MINLDAQMIHFGLHPMEITTDRKIGNLSVRRTTGNGIIITIPNAQADLQTLQRIKPNNIIRQVHIIQFETTVQVLLKLSKRVAAHEIIEDPSSERIFISLLIVGGNDGIASMESAAVKNGFTFAAYVRIA